MNMGYKVYTELKSGHLEIVERLIPCVKNETEPICGHSDPNAVYDCWNSIEEIVGLMIQELRETKFKDEKKIFDPIDEQTLPF